MVVKRAVGVVALALLAAACGKDGQAQQSTSTGGAGSAGAAPGGGEAAQAGTSSSAGSGAGSASVAGAGGQAGAALVGIGDGELDTTCKERTSGHIAGGRISLRSAVTAEGDRAFIGFYDNEKKTECDVLMDAEGKYRCLPRAHDKDMDNRFFLDDKCTDEVQYRGICALDYEAEPLTDELDPCDDRRRVYPFGEALPASEVYERRPGGACQAYGTLNNLHRRGPEVEAADYAELKPAVWRGKGRIWARGYEGEGGLHLVKSLLDSQLDQRCELRAMPDGAVHCAPNRVGNLTRLTGATCKELVLDARSLCGSPAPVYASYPSSDACKAGLSLVQADAPYTAPLYSRDLCMPVTAQGPAFSVKPAPDSDFVTLESSTSTTDAGRLKPMYLTASDGGCFFHDWWDEQLQTRCVFANEYAGAGAYYCQPQPDPAAPSEVVETYTDADCKTPAPLVKVPTCAGAKPPRFASVYAPTCTGTWRSVRAVGATPATLPTTLYVRPSATCQPYAPDPAATYYETGPELPSSMFVAAVPEP